METDQTLPFAELLRRTRMAAGLTQEALAEAAGISTRAVSDLERGRGRLPRLPTVGLLVAALGLTPAERAAFLAAAQPRRGPAVAPAGGSAIGSAPGAGPAEEVAGPSPVTKVPARHNLPRWLSSFIGRARERAEVQTLLATHRLVTLVGMAGAGKTRLALAAAEGWCETCRDGVWLVELAPLADPDLVLGALGAVLRLREESGRPLLQTVIAHLEDRHLLLVMDNCEHLVEACAALANVLLQRCPELRIVATSREALGVPGEQLYAVPSLAVPDPAAPGPLDALGGVEAVRLLMVRAQERRPEFALTTHNAGTVAAICARLEGLPLAIELAAGRVGSLPLEAIAAQLTQSQRLLGGGPRTLPARQQTMQAALDWSWELLNEREQQVLRRLSVFAGGWDLASVEAIVGAGTLNDWDMLDILHSLVARSLVQPVTAGASPRFRLLETVRHYTRRHLEVSGEGPEVRDRHLRCYVDLVETLREALRAREQAEAAARLELERDNTSAALRWARERGAQGLGLRLAVGLRRHWEMSGRLAEGREWLGTLLAIDAPAAERAAAALRAQALNAAGLLPFGQGDYRQATALHEQGLALERGIGDLEGRAATLNNLGNIAVRVGDYARATVLYQEALALFKVLENDSAIATVLNNLGSIAGDRGDYARAIELYDASLSMRRARHDLSGIAESLANLGHIAYARGEYGAAESLLDESLTLRRGLGDTTGMGESLRLLAHVALARGECARAGDLHRESLSLCWQADDLWGMAACLLGLAEVSASLERFKDTIVFCGVAETIRYRIGAILAPGDHDRHQRLMTLACGALGDAAFAAAWERAHVCTLAAAVVQALESSGPN